MKYDVEFLEQHGLPVPDHQIRIIGLAGRAGVGKDTFMEAIPPHEDGGPRELRLAGALKVFYSTCTGEFPNWYDPEQKTLPAAGFPVDRRTWLEHVGQKLCEWDELFWVRVWANRATSRPMLPDANFVVPDVRKPIEAEVIQAYGGVVVRILRPEIDNAPDPHPSTQDIDDISPDRIVTNQGSLEEFEAKARETYTSILNEKGW